MLFAFRSGRFFSDGPCANMQFRTRCWIVISRRLCPAEGSSAGGVSSFFFILLHRRCCPLVCFLFCVDSIPSLVMSVIIVGRSAGIRDGWATRRNHSWKTFWMRANSNQRRSRCAIRWMLSRIVSSLRKKKNAFNPPISNCYLICAGHIELGYYYITYILQDCARKSSLTSSWNKKQFCYHDDTVVDRNELRGRPTKIVESISIGA